MSLSTLTDLVDKHSRTALACIGVAGCVAIYADFRCVVNKQLEGYEKISATIVTLTAEVKETVSAVKENSIRLEHLEREHESARKEENQKL